MEGMMTACLDRAATLAPVVKSEPCGGDSDGRSHASCNTDASAGRLSDTAEQPLLNKTHHLLRHCLNSGQRQEALAHFSSQDVKEAAKEISRMGQRELQGKFKLVYGNTTHSNNNDWLRRKLFEAIGAAPLKANSKGKARKPSSSTKPKKGQSVEPQPHSRAAGFAQPLMVPTGAASMRGSPKAPFRGSCHATSLPMPAKPQLLQQRIAGAPRSMASFPPSPLLTGSVLDLHRHESSLSRDTSDSESWEGEEGEEARNNSNANASSSSSPCYSPRAPAMLVLGQQRPAPHLQHAACALPALQAAVQPAAAAAAACLPAPKPEAVLGLDMLDLGLADANNDWLRDTWGDACDVLGSFALGPPAPVLATQPAVAAVACSPASSLEDDDVMLLPMDLSAIDTFAFA